MNDKKILMLLANLTLTKSEIEKIDVIEAIDWKTVGDILKKHSWVWLSAEDGLDMDFIIPKWTSNQWNNNRLDENGDWEEEQSMELIFNGNLYHISWYYTDWVYGENIVEVDKTKLIEEYRYKRDHYQSLLNKLN